jgi:hypothetical protein
LQASGPLQIDPTRFGGRGTNDRDSSGSCVQQVRDPVGRVVADDNNNNTMEHRGSFRRVHVNACRVPHEQLQAEGQEGPCPRKLKSSQANPQVPCPENFCTCCALQERFSRNGMWACIECVRLKVIAPGICAHFKTITTNITLPTPVLRRRCCGRTLRF